MIGVLITALTIGLCTALFCCLGYASSSRLISRVGSAGCMIGGAVALVYVFLASPYVFPKTPWGVVGYEYFEYGELRIPVLIIAPLCIAGGFSTVGLWKLCTLCTKSHTHT